MAKRNRPVDTFELAEISIDRGPAAAAVVARELLAEGRLPVDTSRGELRTELSDYLEMAGDLAGAEEVVRAAIGDGERGWCDPRIRLAELRHRREDGAERDALLADVWKGRPTDAHDYLAASELLEEVGDAAAALRWVNTGAFRLHRDNEVPTGDTVMLLQRRRRLRLEMGFTEDHYDEVAEVAAQALDDALDDELGWDDED